MLGFIPRDENWGGGDILDDGRKKERIIQKIVSPR